MVQFFQSFSLESIYSFFVAYGSLGIFALGFLEEVIFFIPSAFLFLGFGALSIAPSASLGEAFARAFGEFALPGALGVLCGSFIIYGFAYWGGRPVIERFGGKFGITWSGIERVQRMFSKGYTDEAVLILMRAIPIFPISVVSALCGIMRITPSVFALTTFFGSFVRIGALCMVGWYVGKEYAELAARFVILERYGALVLLVCVALGFVCVFYYRKARRSSKNPNP